MDFIKAKEALKKIVDMDCSFMNGKPLSEFDIYWLKGVMKEALRLIDQKFVYSGGRDLGWPGNLYMDVFGVSDDDVYFLTDDQVKGIEYVLTLLDEREMRIISLRYKEGKTYEEIGVMYGLTRERIRQIIARALRRIRNPQRSVYIKIGLSDAEELVRQKFEEDRQKFLNKFKDPFNERNLSTRPYNVLVRHGVGTIYDILEFEDTASLMALRNMGKTSAQEVVDFLRANGFHHYSNGNVIEDAIKSKPEDDVCYEPGDIDNDMGYDPYLGCITDDC